MESVREVVISSFFNSTDEELLELCENFETNSEERENIFCDSIDDYKLNELCVRIEREEYEKAFCNSIDDNQLNKIFEELEKNNIM